LPILEALAVVVTLAAVYLTTRQNVWCWPLSMVSVTLYSLVFFQAKLYADMGLQALYFGLAIYGWWAWRHGGDSHGELQVSLLSKGARVGLVALGAVAGIALGQALSRLTDASLPFMDSTLTSFSIVGQWMQTRKLLEAWLVWLAVDVFYVGMFLYKGLYPTAGLYAIFLYLAALGFVQWRRSMDPSGSTAQAWEVGLIRVVVTGSECTGKTTLARALADHYRVAMVPEYVRRFVSEKGAAPERSDLEAIARGQIELEDEAAAHAGRLVVLDTDLLSTVIYGRHYYGDCPRWIEETHRRRIADLYLLADIDVPWVVDGDQRDQPDRREEMQGLFSRALVGVGASVIDLRGSRAQRLEIAAAAIDELLSGSR